MNKIDIDFEARFEELNLFFRNKGKLLTDYQDILFKLIDSIDKLPDDQFTLNEIMQFEFFKEIVIEMDTEFKNEQK